MTGKRQLFATVLLFAGCYCTAGRAQALLHSILNIDVENFVQYYRDVADASTFATNPNVTAASVAKNFQEFLTIGDIVAVNGQPAKGTVVLNVRLINLAPAPTPGQAIADVMRSSTGTISFEILGADSTPIGTIHCVGLTGAGPPPPGAPLAVVQANNSIVGGTGAFLGARGQQGNSDAVPPRKASMTEDPANRRTHGGTKEKFVLDVIPAFAPQIVTAAGGPAVTHSRDFSLVTTSKPAAAGEILSLFMTGLGPTRPGVDPGQPFPQSPPQTVNSPVAVTINGEPTLVTAAVGLPGSIGGYQVNFRVPPEAARGAASLQVSAGWIAGAPVMINIQ